MTAYTYKVRRQTRFLDNSAVLKRATSYTAYDETLDIGGLYILDIKGNGNSGFYRVEALISTRNYD